MKKNLDKFNLNLPFNNYLHLDALSYSKLKTVKESSHNFLNKKEDNSLTRIFKARDLGSITDDLLLGDEVIENNYIISKTETPTSNALKLANYLIEYCHNNNINHDEFIDKNKSNKLVFDGAAKLKLWSTFSNEKILERLTDPFWKYLEHKIKILGGKIIITPSQWEKANELVSTLKTHKHTRDIFSYDDSINQFSYQFTLNKIKYKIRLDKVLIDYKNKLIKPYDLKTGDEIASKFGKSFYNNSYYLQAALYTLGMHHLVETHMKDFSVDNFRFIYISTKENNPYPVIYKLQDKWIELGYEGFESKNGIKYKGIKELTSEYLYYMKYKPTLPKHIIEADGEIDFPLPY